MVVITTQPQVFDQNKPADKISTLLTAGSVAFQDTRYKPNHTVPHIRSGTDADNYPDHYPPMGVVLSSNSERHVGRTLPTTMGIQASGVAAVAPQHELGTNVELGQLLMLQWQDKTNCGKPPQINKDQWHAYVPQKLDRATFSASSMINNDAEMRTVDRKAHGRYSDKQQRMQVAGRLGQGVWKSLGIHRRSVGKIVIQTCSMPSVIRVKV